MDKLLFEQIGLTKTEERLYLALLKIGENSTTKIMRESGVPASKTYEFLDKLIKKGLVSYTFKNGRKHFKAENPESIKVFLESKKEYIDKQILEVDKLIPHLNQIKTEKEPEIESFVYEGLNGIKILYEKTLKALEKGETHYIIGAPKIGNEMFEGYLLDWHKRRIKKEVYCKYIYNADAKEYGEIRRKMPLTKVKYLPAQVISPVWTEIAKDYVITGHITNKSAVIFVMKDKEMVKKYINYFDMIWKIAKK
ncbi:MAG: helix-turn-helix domain-containing protein [Nanoarchaeota archaeon]